MASETDADSIPEAVIEPRKRGFRVSLVWLIPLVAAGIGIWLLFKAFTEAGPLVTITFRQAAGLEAGKTPVKYKDVQIGLVEEIELKADLSGVVVSARLDKDTKPYLTDRTRFWVVRARVSAGGVSGLGTLLSGAHIAMDPHDQGTPTNAFTGLEVPPIVTRGLPGRHFILESNTLGSVQVGSPVYYRQLRVGEVVSHTLDDAGRKLTFQIFVEAPYDRFVFKNSRFWNASGIDVSLGASGIRVNTESLTAVLSGGIAFELPPEAPASDRAEPDAVFALYKNRDTAFAHTFSVLEEWVLYFDESVRGLAVGAPVEFRGIRIGEVTSIELRYDLERRILQIPVRCKIEPERVTGLFEDQQYVESEQTRDAVMNQWVEDGLRGELKTGNLLTGQRYIDVDFHPDAPPAYLVYVDGDVVFPTVPSTTERLTDNIARASAGLANIPFPQIGAELTETLQALRTTLAGAEAMLAKLDGSLTPAATQTLAQARAALSAVEETLDKQAPLPRGFAEMLQELTKTARSLRLLAEYLEQHPEALVRGKGGE